VKNKLRVLRAERRWSQADLAERIGVSRQTVNAVENDKYDPSLPLAFRIGAVFQKPIEEIFHYEDGHDGGRHPDRHVAHP
jgi:putative transcriptional regulator